MKKRIIAVILTVLMIMAVCPVMMAEGGSVNDVVVETTTTTETVEVCEECTDDPCACSGILDKEDQDNQQEACDLCGLPTCNGGHVICDICGAYDCNVAHYLCDICGEYDCGNGHDYCEICEVYDDCIGIHHYCDFCKNFDCGLEHISFASENSRIKLAAPRNAATNQQPENTGFVDHKDIETSKSVLYDPETETYKLLLESYVTGSTLTSIIEEGTPADVLLIVDESGSMHQCFYGCGGWGSDNNGCRNRPVYVDDLDTDEVYYYGSSTNKAYYCSNCHAWFDREHTPSEGICRNKGTWYIPEKNNGEAPVLRDFHEEHVHNGCADNCRIQLDAAVYYEYAENLDTSKVYYANTNEGTLTSGKTTANERRWCDTCEGWYGVNDSGVVQCRCVNPNANRTIPRKWSSAGLNSNYFSLGEIARHTIVSQAIDTFVDKIKKDALDNNIDHRVAVVSYGDRGELLTYNNPEGTMMRVPYSNAITEAYAGDSMLRVQDAGERSILEEAVASLDRRTGYGTPTTDGMAVGEAVMRYDQPKDERNKIVILYADGTGTGLDAPAKHAYAMKTEFGATVYTVATMDDADGTLPNPIPAESAFWSSINTSNKFFHLLSSNYPEGEKQDNRGPLNPDLVGGEQGYYLTPTTTEELNKVFDKIYHDVQTGGANVTTLDETTVTRDVVSDHFVIVDGDVSFWTESYIAENTWQKDTTTDSGIQLDSTAGDNKVVSITGFDYSENYVGVDTAADGTETYRGKKLVIEIPIKPADGNNGSVAMDTNVPIDSGIFLDGEAQEHFDQPKVDIPTDVTISKTIVGGSQTSFDFDLNYSAFDNYVNNTGTNGNYLQAIRAECEVSQPISTTEPKELEKVLIGTTLTLTEKDVPNYTVEYSTDGGISWTEMTYKDGNATAQVTIAAGMEIIVRNTLKVVDLTIHKEIFNGENPDQSFLFTVEGGGKNLTVVIPVEAFKNGKASVTVKDLLIGAYTVTELTDWSWRYTVVDAEGKPADESRTVTLSSVGDENAVTFTNTRTNKFWLSGDSFAKNLWGSGTTGIVVNTAETTN